MVHWWAVERALGRTSRHVKSYRCLERVQLLDRPPHAHTYIHTHTTGWDQQLKAFQQAPPSPLSQAELSCSRVTLSWLCPHHKTPSPSCTPVLLVCNGAWWQMRSFDTQTEIQEQANKKKKTRNTECIPFSLPLYWLYLVAPFTRFERVHSGTPVALVSDPIFLSSLQAAQYSVSALCNAIPAPLFVVLMYLEPPTLGAAIIFYQPVKVS